MYGLFVMFNGKQIWGWSLENKTHYHLNRSENHKKMGVIALNQ